MTGTGADAGLAVILTVAVGLLWLGCLVVFVGTLLWAVRTIKNRRQK